MKRRSDDTSLAVVATLMIFPLITGAAGQCTMEPPGPERRLCIKRAREDAQRLESPPPPPPSDDPAACEPGCSACGFNWYKMNWRNGRPTQFWDGPLGCTCCNTTPAQLVTCRRVCILNTAPGHVGRKGGGGKGGGGRGGGKLHTDHELLSLTDLLPSRKFCSLFDNEPKRCAMHSMGKAPCVSRPITPSTSICRRAPALEIGGGAKGSGGMQDHSIELGPVRWPQSANGTWHGALNALSMEAYKSAAGSVCGVVNDVGISVSGGTTTAVLVTNARDEGHLYQWIAHHLLLGFAHVLIFDDLSREPEASLAKLPASLRARVTILLRCPHVPWPKKTVLQQDGVNAAAILGAGWAMHLDADEYLTLRGGHGYGQQGATAPDVPSDSTASNGPLGAWLATLPADTSQVLLNWLMYGSGFREDVGPNEVCVSAPVRHLRASLRHRTARPEAARHRISSPQILFREYAYHSSGLSRFAKSMQRLYDDTSPGPTRAGTFSMWVAMNPHFMHRGRVKSCHPVLEAPPVVTSEPPDPAECEPGCSACGFNWYQMNWRSGNPTQFWDGPLGCSCCNTTTPAQWVTCRRVCIPPCVPPCIPRTNASSCQISHETSASVVRTVWATGERLPRLPNGSGVIGLPPKHRAKTDGVPAFLAHFYLQARFECVRRKLMRVRDDTGAPRVPLETNESLAKWDAWCNHVDHNDVKDPKMLAPYADSLEGVFRPHGGGKGPPRLTRRPSERSGSSWTWAMSR